MVSPFNKIISHHLVNQLQSISKRINPDFFCRRTGQTPPNNILYELNLNHIELALYFAQDSFAEYKYASIGQT